MTADTNLFGEELPRLGAPLFAERNRSYLFGGEDG